MIEPFSANGPRPSVLHLPSGDWFTVLDCLCAHFPAIERSVWLDRIARGRVLNDLGIAIDADLPYREGLRIYYFREVLDEIPILASEKIIYADEHLLVVDKPHFLPVIPAGKYVEQTLLARLIRRFDNPHIAPLHRIDRHTAGLVLFSMSITSRSAYQALFAAHKISKYYEAIAPALPLLTFPMSRISRLVAGEPFFCMREIVGTPNSETLIDVCERRADRWRYGLRPITGKKHQLRVHMAALGAAISNDPLYPQLRDQQPDDYALPLKLLAKNLAFTDPLTGSAKSFDSEINLEW